MSCPTTRTGGPLKFGNATHLVKENHLQKQLNTNKRKRGEAKAKPDSFDVDIEWTDDEGAVNQVRPPLGTDPLAFWEKREAELAPGGTAHTMMLELGKLTENSFIDHYCDEYHLPTGLLFDLKV